MTAERWAALAEPRVLHFAHHPKPWIAWLGAHRGGDAHGGGQAEGGAVDAQLLISLGVDSLLFSPRARIFGYGCEHDFFGNRQYRQGVGVWTDIWKWCGD